MWRRTREQVAIHLVPLCVSPPSPLPRPTSFFAGRGFPVAGMAEAAGLQLPAWLRNLVSSTSSAPQVSHQCVGSHPQTLGGMRPPRLTCPHPHPRPRSRRRRPHRSRQGQEGTETTTWRPQFDPTVVEEVAAHPFCLVCFFPLCLLVVASFREGVEGRGAVVRVANLTHAQTTKDFFCRWVRYCHSNKTGNFDPTRQGL